MNLKKFISLLFITMLFASSVSFAANVGRNVYSIYSDNFNGVHFYGGSDVVPSSDEDGIKEYHWNNQINVSTQSAGVIEGNQYCTYKIVSTNWDVIAYTPVVDANTVAPRDMSAYANGKISFLARSTNESFLTATAGFQYRTSGGDLIYKKTLSELGFVADGNWHELSITVPSSDLGSVIALFLFQPETLTVNNTIDIDNIRWVKQNAGQTFSVVRKKVSDNTDAGQQKITFSSSTFGQGWSVAEQYLELDIDGEMTSNNWSIRAYTNNDKAGLYNGSDVLPTAWRVSCSTLPYTTSDTYDSLEIGETWDETVLMGLHDAGKVKVKGDGAKWWFPWFWFKNSTDGPTATDSIVWCYKGCCTFLNNATYSYDPPTNFHERKPRLYLACKTTDAKAVKYTVQFIFNLRYE